MEVVAENERLRSDRAVLVGACRIVKEIVDDHENFVCYRSDHHAGRAAFALAKMRDTLFVSLVALRAEAGLDAGKEDEHGC